jgi:thiol:disulfide interchange protein
MKTKFLALASLLISLATMPALAGGEGWIDDLDKAFAEAKKSGKPVMAEFTGSDWCPPCKMMQKEVFGKKEFVEQASKKWVLAVVDIPNGKPEVREKNQPILKKYKVSGVPTVILFDAEGKEIDRFGASQFRTVETFLKRLDEGLAKKDMQ